MKSIATCWVCCVLPLPAIAQVYCELLPSPGDSSVSFLFNQHLAATAWTSGVVAGAMYSMPSALPELRAADITAACRLKGLRITAAWHQLGFAGYAEQEGVLAIAMRVGQKAGVSAGFHYFNRLAEGYGHQPGYTFSAGMALKPVSNWLLSVQLQNPAELHYLGSTSILPVLYSFRALHRLSPQVMLGITLHKYDRAPLQSFLFLQYKPHASWGLNGGLGANPAQAGAAMWMRWQGFVFCGRVMYNQWLGTTPAAALAWTSQ
jgi:hypothetical protein